MDSQTRFPVSLVFAFTILLLVVQENCSVAQTGTVYISGLGLDQAKDDKPNVMRIESVQPKSDRGLGGTPFGLTRNDFKAIKSSVSMFGTTIPIRVVEHLVLYQGDQLQSQIIGTTPDFKLAGSVKIVKGSFLSQNDQRKAENICVINEPVARQFFGESNPIGKSIRINKNFFMVVGIAKTRNPTSLKNERVIFVPLSTMQFRFGDTHVETKKGRLNVSKVQLHEIQIHLNETGDATKTFTQIRALLKKIHPKDDYLLFFKKKKPVNSNRNP